MLTINNIDKIFAINSQDVEVMSWDWDNDYYTFDFVHDNIYSAQFRVHMSRYPDKGDNDSYKMELWDGINSTPLTYNFGLHDVKDPFTLLSYLHDVINDWDNVTNK
jgi:hypothetical protein